MTVIVKTPFYLYTRIPYLFLPPIYQKKDFNIRQRITFYFKLVRGRWDELVY